MIVFNAYHDIDDNVNDVEVGRLCVTKLESNKLPNLSYITSDYSFELVVTGYAIPRARSIL